MLNPPSIPATEAVGVPQVMHIYDALHGRGTMAIIAKQTGVVRAYTSNTMQVFPGQLYSAAAWFRAEIDAPGQDANLRVTSTGILHDRQGFKFLPSAPTGGTFTLTYDGQTTAPIAFDASAATVQAALEALFNLAPGDVSVITQLSFANYVIIFEGALAIQPQSNITSNGALLTGPAAPYTVNQEWHDVGGTPVDNPGMDHDAGSFTVTFRGQTSTTLPATTTGPNLQTALEGLSTVGAGNVLVEVSNPPGNVFNQSGSFNVHFTGVLGQQPIDVAELSFDTTGLVGGEFTDYEPYSLTTSVLTAGMSPPGSSAAEALVGIEWRNALDEVLSTTEGLVITDTSVEWLESVLTSVAAPSNSASARMMLELRAVVPGDTHYVEEAWFGRGVYADWSAPAPNVLMNIHESSIVGGIVGTPGIANTSYFSSSILSGEVVPAPNVVALLSGGDTGISSAEVFGTAAFTVSEEWWSFAYPYRRSITVTTTTTQEAPVLHPVEVAVPLMIRNQGKLQSDCDDLEIVHFVDHRWYRIPRTVVEEAEQFTVRFLVDQTIPGQGTDTYYVYHGAPAAVGTYPTDFTDNVWPIRVPHDGPGVSYTKPGEDWRNGKTTTKGARATFEFAGVSVRAISATGPADARAEVQIDNGPWDPISLYSATTDEQAVFSRELLSPEPHKLRMRTAGRANAKFAGSALDVLYFDFVAALQVALGPEEVLTDRWAGGGVGGG